MTGPALRSFPEILTADVQYAIDKCMRPCAQGDNRPFTGIHRQLQKITANGRSSTSFLTEYAKECLLLSCVAWQWCHIRELVWNWLDTQSRLKIVAAVRDPWLQSGLDFGTAETLYLLYVLHIDEEHHAKYESICWYLPSPSESSASFSDEC